MKKFIRFVVVLVVAVICGILMLGMYEPKDVLVERSVVMSASKDSVFNQIQYFKNWPNWSPWYQMDSGKMKMGYYGTDGQAGSGYTWEGERTGAGDMRDSAINGTQMTYKLNITKPGELAAWGQLAATDTAGMTKVTWTCQVHFTFPFNAVLVSLNMDKLLGPDFETGLNNMKSYLEAHNSKEVGDTAIKEVGYPAHTFMGMRRVVAMKDITRYFDSVRNIIIPANSKTTNWPSSGIYYTWDTVHKVTDVAAVFPIADSSKATKNIPIIYIGASKAVMAIYKGGYGKEAQTHAAIIKYMAAKSFKQNIVIEEYVVGPHEEADSNKWVTNIYYLER